jgi:hypothetical protein
MSRSGYTDGYDYDNGSFAMYRGVVASALRGKRGQTFLRDLVEALDAMPERRLIEGDLIREEPPCGLVRWLFAAPNEYRDDYDPRRPDTWRMPESIEWRGDCGVCAIGALGQKRGISMNRLDPEDATAVGAAFDIAEQLAREVVWENDEASGRITVVPSRYDPVSGRYVNGVYRDETPEERWQRMRTWATRHMKDGAA